MAIELRYAVVSLIVFHACGGASSGPPVARTPEPTIAGESGHDSIQPMEPGKGSSDGTTCEQARESYVEEVNVGGARGQSDLSASDFAAVLNQGSYLEPCALPASSKLRICAAVQNGHAIGVTVAAAPSAPEVEICVAKEVRKLAFPTHAKMDVVNVQF